MTSYSYWCFSLRLIISLDESGWRCFLFVDWMLRMGVRYSFLSRILLIPVYSFTPSCLVLLFSLLPSPCLRVYLPSSISSDFLTSLFMSISCLTLSRPDLSSLLYVFMSTCLSLLRLIFSLSYLLLLIHVYFLPPFLMFGFSFFLYLLVHDFFSPIVP